MSMYAYCLFYILTQFKQVMLCIASTHAHCKVLPPGEFNGIIQEPLPVYSESSWWQLQRFSVTLLKIKLLTKVTKDSTMLLPPGLVNAATRTR